jgi:hypothetical protein
MFRWLRKRRAIRAYRRELGPQLRARHGEKQHYSREEVIGGVRAGGFSEEFDCFALAMFCSESDFDAYHQAAGLVCDYGAMRGYAECGGFDGAPVFDAGDASHHDGSWTDFFDVGGGHDGGGDCDGGDFGGDCGGD